MCIKCVYIYNNIYIYIHIHMAHTHTQTCRMFLNWSD